MGVEVTGEKASTRPTNQRRGIPSIYSRPRSSDVMEEAIARSRVRVFEMDSDVKYRAE